MAEQIGDALTASQTQKIVKMLCCADIVHGETESSILLTSANGIAVITADKSKDRSAVRRLVVPLVFRARHGHALNHTYN